MTDEHLFQPPEPLGPAGESAFEPPAADATDQSPERLAVVATSRSNVLEWLSSGLITPRRAFDKYYDDSLALREDIVPVIRAPVPAWSLDVEGGIGNFPVLLELDPGVVRWIMDDRLGWIPPTPLTAARHIHFRDEDDREEFEAREYENVFPNRIQFAVSPQLFDSGDDLDIEVVRTALQGAEDGPTAEEFRTADRLSGSRVLGVQAATGSRETLEWFAVAALSPAVRRTARRKLKHPSTWLELSPELSDYRPANGATFDERLFRAAASAFISHNRVDAWDANAVLTRIDRMLVDDDAVKGADAKRWATARDRAAAVLRGDEAFTGFKAGDFRSEKALLLALVRDQPADVLQWREEDGLQADALDLLLAAVLVGLAHGRKALPTALRPQELDDALAARELADLGTEPVSGSIEVQEEAGSLALAVEGRVVLRTARRPRTSEELFDDLDLSTTATVDALVELARRRGWIESVATTIRAPGPMELKAVGAGFEMTLLGPVEVVSELRAEALRSAIAADADPDVHSALQELADRSRSNESSDPADGLERN